MQDEHLKVFKYIDGGYGSDIVKNIEAGKLGDALQELAKALGNKKILFNGAPAPSDIPFTNSFDAFARSINPKFVSGQANISIENLKVHNGGGLTTTFSGFGSSMEDAADDYLTSIADKLAKHIDNSAKWYRPNEVPAEDEAKYGAGFWFDGKPVEMFMIVDRKGEPLKPESPKRVLGTRSTADKLDRHFS